MFDPQMELFLTAVVATLEDPAADMAQLQQVLVECGETEPDLQLAVRDGDRSALRAIVDAWMSGKRHLIEHDRAVLKRALKAFRKRLKVTLLDAESSIGGGPMSGGRKSSIVAITPPHRYPRAVWDELVRQKRLLGGKDGMYELVPE